MTIIVKHKRTGNNYILLGMNGGGNKTSLPTRFLNDLFTKEEQDNPVLVTLCDARGNIFLSQVDEIIITEIEGKKPSELLPESIKSVVVDRFDAEFEDEDENEFETESNQDFPSIAPPPLQKPDFDLERKKFDEDEEDWI